MLHAAGGSDQRHLFDDVLDVAVSILLHPAGIGGDPSSQGREFDAVGFVTGDETGHPELAFQFLPRDARLDQGPLVLAVDPFDAIHPPHVHRNDHALFRGRKLQRATDAGAAAVGNEADVLGPGQRHQHRAILLRFGVDDHVGDAFELGVDDPEDLVGTGLPVAVDESLAVVEGELIGTVEIGQATAEPGVQSGGGNRFGIDLGPFFLEIGIESQDFSHVGEEVVHLVAAQLVTITREGHRVIVIEDETGVGESPTVPPGRIFFPAGHRYFPFTPYARSSAEVRRRTGTPIPMFSRAIVHTERVMRNSGRFDSGEEVQDFRAMTRPQSASARGGWRHAFSGRAETGFRGGGKPATRSGSHLRGEYPGSGYGREG